MGSTVHSGRRERGEGQVIVLFALFALVLVGMLALAVDVGYLLTERREAQSAADAAALAGAAALLGGDTEAAVAAVSRDYAQMNGINSGTVDVDVQGNSQDGSVTVDMEVPVQRFFLGAIYSGSWQVGAHAIAEVTALADARYALVSLDPPGIYMNGNMSLTVINGGIISNGNIEASGGSNIVTSDGYIDAVGTINENDNWVSPPEYGIRENRGGIGDPFEAVTAPNPTGTVYTTNITCNDACPLYPGHYQNVQIRLHRETTLSPGLYYFENSSIELIGSNASITGTGVTLYFDGVQNKEYFKPNNGDVDLIAQNWPDPAGDYGDMAIWVDNCGTIDAQGNGDFYLGGVLYAPCSKVYLHGNPEGETVSGMVVASTVDIRGDSDFVISYIPYGPTVSYEVYLRE